MSEEAFEAATTISMSSELDRRGGVNTMNKI
jgi:hypothetical protein